jgi:hemerythrin-like domain-containing protein
MNISIKNMMEEHRLIEHVLASLENYIEQLKDGQPASRRVVADFATFFRQFADQCHHGKEEDRLFVKMNQCGFPREHGPIAVMLSEHDEGRRHVSALADIGQAPGPCTPADAELIIHHGGSFIPLLRTHIQKEDNILYPMAQQAIPPAEFDQLDAACLDFDRQTIGTEKIQQLKDLAQQLVHDFPPDPENMTAASVCTGCCGPH